MSPDCTVPEPADRVTGLIELALGQTRQAHTAILDTIHPNLPPARRLGAERMMRLLETSGIFRVPVLDELDALIRQVEQEIANGTSETFRPNESDPTEGHVERVHDAHALALEPAQGSLRLLHRRITDVMDAVEAQRIASALIASD